MFLTICRYFLYSYENALINECNYKGAQPYWDWTAANPEYGSSFEKAAVFDPVTGFGSNGAQGSVAVPADADQQAVPPGSCIADGPFATTQVNLGYGYSVASNPHCIMRNFQIDLANESLGWTKNILPLVAETTYWNMSQAWDTSNVGAPVGPHGAGHKGVGGEMWDIWSSVNDPLFFMHHAQIDHIFWYWQTQKASNKNLIGGPIYPNGTGTVTGDYVLEMTPFIAPSIRISNVLDTINQNGAGVLCYTYEDSGTAGYKRLGRFKRS
jgi:tyrosinase